jgi:hypothetical protein
MRLLLHVRNKYPNLAGSLEGFMETKGRRVPYSMNWDMALADPALAAEMVAHARKLALEGAVALPADPCHGRGS